MLQPSGARLGCEEGGWGTWQCVPPVHNPSRWGRSPPHSEVGTVGGRLLSLLHKSHFTREGPARPHTRDAGLPRQLERRAGGSSRPTAARPRLGPRALQALLFKLFRVADARGAAGGSGGDRATQRRRAAAGILRFSSRARPHAFPSDRRTPGSGRHAQPRLPFPLASNAGCEAAADPEPHLEGKTL